MIFSRHSRKTVFVMSGPGTNCPRIVLSLNTTRLRDDYKGSFKTDSRLIKKILQTG